MTVIEFYRYLLSNEATLEIAVELVDVHAERVRLQRSRVSGG